MNRLGPASILFLLCMAGPAGQVQSAEPVDYLRDVKPLLARRCTTCHGALRQRGQLRLDAAVLLKQGGESGTPIEAGRPDDSLLMGVVTGEAGFRMPPEGDPLGDEEIGLLRTWIEQGAPAPEDEPVMASPRDHWAYRLPLRGTLPQPKNADWVRNPIDAYIAAGHEDRGLWPVPPASQRTLIRRVFLDLIGLPPTPADVHRFLEDGRPDAYERLVDQLLEDPRYGERWGRHWMDVWRYSDWYGYRQELRNSVRHIWRWRDWIVEALNGDRAYDRMILEMLAADEIDPGNPESLRATGFVARNYYKYNRNVWLNRAVEHTSKAFLGLTVDCARCHDHMYDPISQMEYYQFRAIFEPYKVRDDPLPGVSDVTQDGLSLAYDAQPDAPTYLFVRGNDKMPDEEHPLAPGIPSLLSDVPFAVEAVNLPPEAYYPGLRGYVQEQLIAEAETALRSAQNELVQASSRSADARRRLQLMQAAAGDAAGQSAMRAAAELARIWAASPSIPLGLASVPTCLPRALAADEISVETTASAAFVAEQAVAAAQAARDALVARMAAENAKYAQPPPENYRELVLEAAGAERRQKLAEAALTVAKANAALERLRRQDAAGAQAKKADGEPKTIGEAEQKVREADEHLAAARKALESDEADYSALTERYPQTSTGRRSALARWIADNQNPLTARVAVNHIWMRHFGAPLVPSVFDFGINGQPPSHPGLLDWLAVEFMESGWRMKHLHRMMVLSSTYRARSYSQPETVERNSEIDPDNVMLWRMNTRRMEAEVVRDSLLRVAGQLDQTMGGPELDSASGHTTFRRSLYYRHAPEKLMTFLTLFDSANPAECYRRNVTVVPQQALALANSPLSIEQARRLTARLNQRISDSSADADAFIVALFECVLCRRPGEAETRACREFLENQMRLLSNADRLTRFQTGADLTVKGAQAAGMRARENLAHVLLNHNEFLTLR